MKALPPTPDAQLEFLTKVQRVFREGEFTATYKFALLIVLADLAVERGADDGEELALPVPDIAERFVDLYWQQSAPYHPLTYHGRIGLSHWEDGDHQGPVPRDGENPGSPIEQRLVLMQNPGRQAAVIKAIQQFRKSTNAKTITQARSGRSANAYWSLVRQVAATVSEQPLTYLQNLGGQTDEFLYYRSRGLVHLKAGVPFCLRRFQPLIQDAARSAWVSHVRGLRDNQQLLGSTNDLELFLFSTARESLAHVRKRLINLEGNTCFYCGARRSELDVDHFIPFALYPRDLIHNFVLADPACNRSKSDSLAASPHLERWSHRLARSSEDLASIGDEVGITVDLEAHRNVAKWAYLSARISGAAAWLGRRRYQPIADADLVVLAA